MRANGGSVKAALIRVLHVGYKTSASGSKSEQHARRNFRQKSERPLLQRSCKLKAAYGYAKHFIQMACN